MNWRRLLIAAATLAAIGTPAAAQQALKEISTEPGETLIVSCDWREQFGTGTTITTFTWAVPAELQSGAAGDPHPEAIVALQMAAEGLLAPLKIVPRGYCSTPTATLCDTNADCPGGQTCKSRHGKKYLVKVTATFANGMTLTCSYYIKVAVVR